MMNKAHSLLRNIFILLTILVCADDISYGKVVEKKQNGALNEAFRFDFESTSTEGWEISSGKEEQAVSQVAAAATEFHSGGHALKSDIDLDPSNNERKKGVIFVMYPGDMANRPISVWVKFPREAGGDPSHRNGVQLFAKDQNFNIQESFWHNIGYDIPTGEWVELRFTPSAENGFDPTQVMLIGLKIGLGAGSNTRWQGSFYMDDVCGGRTPLTVPESDHLFDFNSLTPEQQREKPFGRGPYWDIDPAWCAGAWKTGDITVQDGMSAISAAFTLENLELCPDSDDEGQKGFVGIELHPDLDIQNKENRVIRAEVKIEPLIGPETLLASIWVYDRRDAGAENRWYRSRDIRVGGAPWNEIVFDLNNPDHYYYIGPEREPDPKTLYPIDIKDDSLKNILKVGIQFYANAAFTGNIFLDKVTVGGKEQMNFQNLNQGFVTRQGSDFRLNGETYRFGGNNTYYMFYKSHFMIDDVFTTMRRNGLEVLRTWAFCDGKGLYARDGDGIADGNEGSAFQPEMGVYYEPTLVNLDYVIKSAGEHGIRLILPLVNYWSDIDVQSEDKRKNSYGGIAQYLEWCGVAPEYDAEGRLSNKAGFYTNPCAKAAYKAWVSHILNRVNTLTGIPYKNDPTIMAWELINEGRCENKTQCQNDLFYHWAEEMSAFVKTLAPNQMVGIGDEGFFNEPGAVDPEYNGDSGMDWERNLSIASIDFGTVRLYPDQWGKDPEWAEKWITDHIRCAEKMGKPVIFEEFGVKVEESDNNKDQDARNQLYAAWLQLFLNGEAIGADGDLVWMIAGRVNGPQESHVEIHGNYYYMDEDDDGYIFWEDSKDADPKTMDIIKQFAALMKVPRQVGDLNFDGESDIVDAVIALQICSGISPPSPYHKCQGPFDETPIGMRDVLYIFRMLTREP